MKNVHVREFAVKPEALEPLIVACWSGTDDDPFPRDIIASWRKNPAGSAPNALIPGVTSLGHASMSFRFERWDGRSFRVSSHRPGYVGTHGFDVVATESGTRITHVLDLNLTGFARVVWPLFIESIHDWAVESIFDRMQTALDEGAVPELTSRPMPWLAGALFAILRRRRAQPHLEVARTGRLHALS